jgi:hypothetical protein
LSDLTYQHQTFHLQGDILKTGKDWYKKNSVDLFVGDAFQQWLNSRQDLSAYVEAHRPYPVFLAVGEGGGIRAAYCLAVTLAEYQDLVPSFRRHLFAISGVSGGSVGASLFFHLCESAEQPEDTTRIDKWVSVTDKILGQDFLTPCLAALLGPEVLQHLVPLRSLGLDRWLDIDRGLALENAFSQAIELHTGSVKHSAVDLVHSYHPDKNLPLLFFNATDANSGARVVLTPRAVDTDTLDSYLAVPSDINVNDAAFISARFPLVSPVAYLEDTSGAEVALLDGGYYDNTGVWTLNQVIACLNGRRQDVAKTHSGLSFRFIVIQPRYYTHPIKSKVIQRHSHLDFLPFLQAINAAREQHALAARIEANDPSAAIEVIRFGYGMLPKSAQEDDRLKGVVSDLDVPLGWALSPQDRTFLRKHLVQVVRSVRRLQTEDPLLLH